MPSAMKASIPVESSSIETTTCLNRVRSDTVTSLRSIDCAPPVLSVVMRCKTTSIVRTPSAAERLQAGPERLLTSPANTIGAEAVRRLCTNQGALQRRGLLDFIGLHRITDGPEDQQV